MRVVVDSNIVFRAILNTKSKIGQLMLNGSKYFNFFTVGLLKEEIMNHKDKILELTKYSQDQFNETYQLIISRITFVDDILLADENIQKAMDLVSDIDQNDVMFVALNNHLLAHLWTGDKRLIIGLRNKGYFRILTTDELYEIFLNKQLKTRKKENKKRRL